MSNDFVPNSTGWRYSDLSKAVGGEGGVDVFVNKVFTTGRSEGRAEGVIGTLVGVGLTALAAWGSKKFFDWRQKKKVQKLAKEKDQEDTGNSSNQ